MQYGLKGTKKVVYGFKDTFYFTVFKRELLLDYSSTFTSPRRAHSMKPLFNQADINYARHLAQKVAPPVPHETVKFIPKQGRQIVKCSNLTHMIWCDLIVQVN